MITTISNSHFSYRYTQTIHLLLATAQQTQKKEEKEENKILLSSMRVERFFLSFCVFYREPLNSLWFEKGYCIYRKGMMYVFELTMQLYIA